MKKFTTLISCILGLLLSYHVIAQPANDDACNAQLLTMGSTVMGNCNLATVQGSELSPPNLGNDCTIDWCDGTLDATVWYKFMAPASGIVTLSSCNPNNIADTQFALYSVGDCSDFATFALLAANDDKSGTCSQGSNPYASELSICSLTSGQTYYLQIDGYNGDFSDFELSISTSSSCPNFADLQFVHSSADLSIPTLDVRIDGALVADNLNFGDASAFIHITNISSPYITINPANSTDDSNPLYAISVPFDPQSRFVIPIVGINDVANYDISTTNATLALTGVQIPDVPVHPNNEHIAFFNCVTDIQGFRYYYDGVDAYGPVQYGQGLSDEYSLSNLPFNLYAISNPTHYAKFNVPFENYIGQSITVVTTGFIDPAQNNGGADLSMCVVHQNGTVDCFVDELSVSDLAFELGLNVYPNPANDQINVHYTLLKDQGNVELSITTITGQGVFASKLNTNNSGPQEQAISISNLPSGTYWVQLKSENSNTIPKKLVVTH